MILIRRFICFLGIHKPYFISFRFTDKVINKAVNLYGCEWCNKKWMALTHKDIIKIYK